MSPILIKTIQIYFDNDCAPFHKVDNILRLREFPYELKINFIYACLKTMETCFASSREVSMLYTSIVSLVGQWVSGKRTKEVKNELEKLEKEIKETKMNNRYSRLKSLCWTTTFFTKKDGPEDSIAYIAYHTALVLSDINYNTYSFYMNKLLDMLVKLIVDFYSKNKIISLLYCDEKKGII